MAGSIAALGLGIAVAVAACTGEAPTAVPVGTDGAVVDPADRVVAVVTTGCGQASAALGSAVRLDDRIMVTAAHVIAGASAVGVVDAGDLPQDRQWPGFSPSTLFEAAEVAAVVAVDHDRDLALLSIDHDRSMSDGLSQPELGAVGADAPVEIHGVTAAGPIRGTVAERTTIVADEVRGGARVERDGYRLDGVTDRGDSGAGVWDEDGRLVGIVFAVSASDESRTWAVSGVEIERLLQAAATDPIRSHRCDESRSRLVTEP